MKVCVKCDVTKDESEFYLKRGKPNSWCKVCQNLAAKESISRRRRNVKVLLIEESGGVCSDCSFSGPPFMFDFDHRDPTQKSFAISASTVIGIDRLREEAKKCDLVCANCHRMRTHRQRCKGCEHC